jgi:hypothetical protein
MEIRFRPALVGLALFMVGALGALLARDAWLPAVMRLLAQPALVPVADLPIQMPGSPKYRFFNGSAQWDWQTDGCSALLEGFLKQYPVRSAKIVLTDDTQGLVISTVYPDLTAPQARARVLCKGADGELTCRVAVQQGQAGDALSVAVTTAIAWGVEDFFRPRTDAAWNAAQNTQWSWEHFRPLITNEGESGWRSACLSVSHK